MKILMLAPPGGGKGTQGHRVAEELGLEHISSGDLLRAAVAADTPVGREVAGYMAAGQLAPDAVVTEAVTKSLQDHGPHGFSEILYAFSSMGNNNGSAFAGLSANTPFYNTLGGIAMLVARYWLAIPTLAIAGSLARKKYVPASAGTLPTHTPLFVVMLIGVVIIVGVLTFVPALALGPIVEHLMLAA